MQGWELTSSAAVVITRLLWCLVWTRAWRVLGATLPEQLGMGPGPEVPRAGSTGSLATSSCQRMNSGLGSNGKGSKRSASSASAALSFKAPKTCCSYESSSSACFESAGRSEQDAGDTGADTRSLASVVRAVCTGMELEPELSRGAVCGVTLLGQVLRLPTPIRGILGFGGGGPSRVLELALC